MMLDTESLENLMACERIKEELKTVEGECARILERFDQREEEPTAAEREVRRQEFIKIRMELGELHKRILRLSCAVLSEQARRDGA
jgi:hypothetical protein